MARFTHDEVQSLLHLARDATIGDTFETRLATITDHLLLLVPSTSQTAIVIGPRGPGPVFGRNVTRDSLDTYAGHYMHHDPMVTRGPFGTDAVAALSDVVTESEFGRDPFTADFLPAHGVRHVLGVSPRMPDGALLSIGIQRERALGDFTAKERRIIGLVKADVGRAAFTALLQEKIARMARTATRGARQGAVVFDEHGEVLQADAGALGMCPVLAGSPGLAPLDALVTEVRRLIALGVGAAAERTIATSAEACVRMRMDVVSHATGLRVVAVLQRVDGRAAAFSALLLRAGLTPREREVAA